MGTKESDLRYNKYEGAPHILKTSNKVEDQIGLSIDGNFVLQLKGFLPLGTKKITIPKENFFDLVPVTIYGLLDDLIPGSSLMEAFLREVKKFEDVLKKQTQEIASYGTLVYYSRKNHLVKFAPPSWHRLALIVRNSTLFQDPNRKMNWEEVRIVFEKTLVAIAGCSVGNNIVHAVIGDLRPLCLKIADQKEYHIPNANRVRLTYEDFGRNKAVVTAEQIHAIDPFMKISVYQEGLHPANIEEFVRGSSVIIEEMDDPDMKLLIREEARRSGIPVVMVTDLGSVVQMDVRRFDKNKNLPLAACGVSDKELYKARDQWRDDLADRDKFWDFAFTFIGYHAQKSSEFYGIIKKTDPVLFGGLPQLGSTAIVAAGIASEAIARLVLGFPIPERMFIHKYTGETGIEGKTL
ncbi:MAG TPA: ThiF family adenylyltransferase [Candidatus Paceibacterota bacterium]